MKRNRVDEVQFGAPRGPHHRILTTQQNTGMYNNHFVTKNTTFQHFYFKHTLSIAGPTIQYQIASGGIKPNVSADTGNIVGGPTPTVQYTTCKSTAIICKPISFIRTVKDRFSN